MTDQKNTILALVLSAVVLLGWQYFFGMPQLEKQRQITQQQSSERGDPGKVPPSAPPTAPGQTPPSGPGLTREAALALSPRIAIETPSLHGSVALKGGRIDDLALVRYRETVDPTSPAIFLLSPSG